MNTQSSDNVINCIDPDSLDIDDFPSNCALGMINPSKEKNHS